MRCLPVADDCGISCAVTQGILACIDNGSLRGTSIIANGACAKEAAVALAERLYTHPELRVGIHINLLEGRAIAPTEKIPLLVDENGWFRYSLGHLWYAVTYGPQKLALQEQIFIEICAQVELIQGALLHGWQTVHAANNACNSVPTVKPLPACYLDGHLHVHAIPALQPVLAALFTKYSFCHVRVPIEQRTYLPAPLSLQIRGNLRRELLAHWGRQLRVFLQQERITFPHYFIGAFASGCMTASVLEKSLVHIAGLANTQNSLVEIMFHPSPRLKEPLSFCGPSVSALTPSSPQHHARLASAYDAKSRQVEMSLLVSPQYHQLMQQFDASWPLQEVL